MAHGGLLAGGALASGPLLGEPAAGLETRASARSEFGAQPARRSARSAPALVVAWGQATATLREGGDNQTIGISAFRRLDGEPVAEGELSVSFTVGGAATSGADYQLSSSASLLFREGRSNAQLRIRVIDDRETEPAETIEITLQDGEGFLVDPRLRTLVVTLVDNDEEVESNETTEPEQEHTDPPPADEETQATEAETAPADDPTPAVTSLSPESASLDRPFRLTVRGSGFDRTSVIHWADQPVSTTFVSESELRARITPPLLRRQRGDVVPVRVVNRPPGGSASDAVSFGIVRGDTEEKKAADDDPPAEEESVEEQAAEELAAEEPTEEPAAEEPPPDEQVAEEPTAEEEPPPAVSGKAPTPDLRVQDGSQCPADIALAYDISHLAGADGISWELRGGSPGTVPSWETAVPLDRGSRNGASGTQPLSLRSYGPTLDGTPYLARIRATQAGQEIGEWSDASAAYRPGAHTPDEMYRASAATSADGTPAIRLDWSLVSQLADCADRVHYELERIVLFSAAGEPDPPVRGGTFPGTAGDQLLSLPDGPGEYDLRLVARYGGDAPDNDVGTYGDALRVQVPEAPAEPVAAESGAACDGLDPSLAPRADMFSATPTVDGDPARYELRIDWNLTGDLAVCADRVAWELMKGRTFTSDVSDLYMSQTMSGTSGSYSAFLPEGPDTYWVRILARSGGSTNADNVGQRSPAKQVTVGQRYEVEIEVIDAVASECTGSAVVAPGAAVALVRPDGSRQTAVSDVEGMARLSVLEGSYEVNVAREGCSIGSEALGVPGTLQLTESGVLVTSVELPGCWATGDLAALLSSPSTNPVGGQPYPLAVTVRSVGEGPAGPSTVQLTRNEEGGSSTRIATEDVLPLCRGEERVVELEDPNPEADATYTYSAFVSPQRADANAGNNTSTRTVAFANDDPISTDAVANEPVESVSISSFAIRNGLPFVTGGRSVTLEAVVTGSPTEYRAAETTGSCDNALSGAGWLPWSASAPPTWIFSGAGRKTICFQLRASTETSTGVSEIVRDDIEVVRSSLASANTNENIGFRADGPFISSPLELSGRLDCADGFAVGIVLRSGFYVDAVALRCASLGPNGEHLNSWTTDFMGGPEGTTNNLQCLTGEVVTGIGGRHNGSYLDRLAISCSPWQHQHGSYGLPRTLGSIADLEGEDSFSCGGPHAVRELYNVYMRDAYVTSFDVICVVPEGM